MQAEQKQECTLIWFRNDLRIEDNALLQKAVATQKYLVAFYVFDAVFYQKQKGFTRTGVHRTKFLIDTLLVLQKRLADFNIPLFVYTNTTKVAIETLKKTFSISKLVFQSDSTFDEKNIENQVLNSLSKRTSIIKVFNQYLYSPEQIDELFLNGIPKSFSSFRKKVEKKLKVQQNPSYKILKQEKRHNSVLEFPNLTSYKRHPFSAFPFDGGEITAKNRIESYFFETKNILNYKFTRNNLLGVNYSSKFSPWLANGALSAMTLYWKLKAFETAEKQNISTYWLYFELLWRDFFKHTARFYGVNMFLYKGIQKNKSLLKNENKLFIKQWISGTTPNNFINANMIELNKTGWMSNRGRQNVASYFIHNLQQDWRIGAAYFESMLLDYDPHSNYGNWMYIAGVGNDTRNKKFDINWQAKTYDPENEFVTKWIDCK